MAYIKRNVRKRQRNLILIFGHYNESPLKMDLWPMCIYLSAKTVLMTLEFYEIQIFTFGVPNDFGRFGQRERESLWSEKPICSALNHHSFLLIYCLRLADLQRSASLSCCPKQKINFNFQKYPNLRSQALNFKNPEKSQLANMQKNLLKNFGFIYLFIYTLVIS